MRLVWNREIKRLCIELVSVSLLAVFACNLALAAYREKQNREYAAAVAALVGSVMDAYPETSEESLMRALNGKDNLETGEILLAHYGILPEDGVTFLAQEKRIASLQWELNLLVVLFFTVLTVIVILYLGRRQERIYRLAGYMAELVRGNDELDIRDNGDDELSGLKNEVYKLTVFFREQAKQAAANRKALADSVADISHQLKTPLTSVMVLVDNLSESENMDEMTRRRFLTEVSSQLSGVVWLVAALLKLSRLDAGVVELEDRPFQAKQLAEEVCRRLEMNAEWNQVELQTDIPDHIGLSGDFKWLTEALLNVVKNAVEHSEQGGTVRISAQENDVYTLLTVQNRGQVIGQEEQKHLFERFYRGRSAKENSIGIGLALAREILLRQDGIISVESEEGRGTIFLLKFLKCH